MFPDNELLRTNEALHISVLITGWSTSYLTEGKLEELNKLHSGNNLYK